MSLEAFKACDGTRFWKGDRTYVIRAGRYSTENGALFVENARGEREFSLTVNLVELNHSLPDGMFFVRLEIIESSDLPARMLALGIFEREGTVVAQGHAERYAEGWVFAECRVPEHEHQGLAVACQKCRLRWASGAA
jgi:hypothetical protein